MGYKVTTSERLDPSTTLVTSWGMGGGGGAQAGGGDEDPAAMHVVKVVNEGAGIVMGQVRSANHGDEMEAQGRDRERQTDGETEARDEWQKEAS